MLVRAAYACAFFFWLAGVVDHEESVARTPPMSPSGEDAWGGMLAGPTAPSSPPPLVSPRAAPRTLNPVPAMDSGAKAAALPRSAAAAAERAGGAQCPYAVPDGAGEAGEALEHGNSERRGGSAAQPSPPARPARQASGNLEDAGARVCTQLKTAKPGAAADVHARKDLAQAQTSLHWVLACGAGTGLGSGGAARWRPEGGDEGPGGGEGGYAWLASGQRWLTGAGRKVVAAAKDAQSSLQSRLGELDRLAGKGGPRPRPPAGGGAVPTYFHEWAAQLAALPVDKRAAALGAMPEDDRLVLQRILDQEAVARSPHSETLGSNTLGHGTLSGPGADRRERLAAGRLARRGDPDGGTPGGSARAHSEPRRRPSDAADWDAPPAGGSLGGPLGAPRRNGSSGGLGLGGSGSADEAAARAVAAQEAAVLHAARGGQPAPASAGVERGPDTSGRRVGADEERSDGLTQRRQQTETAAEAAPEADLLGLSGGGPARPHEPRGEHRPPADDADADLLGLSGGSRGAGAMAGAGLHEAESALEAGVQASRAEPADDAADLLGLSAEPAGARPAPGAVAAPGAGAKGSNPEAPHDHGADLLGLSGGAPGTRNSGVSLDPGPPEPAWSSGGASASRPPAGSPARMPRQPAHAAASPAAPARGSHAAGHAPDDDDLLGFGGRADAGSWGGSGAPAAAPAAPASGVSGLEDLLGGTGGRPGDGRAPPRDAAMIDFNGDVAGAAGDGAHAALYADKEAGDGSAGFGRGNEPELRRVLRARRRAEMHERMRAGLAEKTARDTAEASAAEQRAAAKDAVAAKMAAWQVQPGPCPLCNSFEQARPCNLPPSRQGGRLPRMSQRLGAFS